MMGYGWAGWYGGLWMIGGLLLVVGVVLLVVYLTNDSRPRVDGPPAAGPTPQAILRERFARGEIGEDEFRRAIEVLGPER